MFTINEIGSLPQELIDGGIIKSGHIQPKSIEDTLTLGDLREFTKDMPDNTRLIFLDMGDEQDYPIFMLNLNKDNSEVTNYTALGADTLTLLGQ